MFRTPPGVRWLIGIVAIVPVDQADQLRFELTGKRCQTVITQLPLRITIAHIEAFEQNRFHFARKYCDRGLRVFQ